MFESEEAEGIEEVVEASIDPVGTLLNSEFELLLDLCK